MARIDYPGVYLDGLATGAVPITGVSTSTAGFVGKTARGVSRLQLVTSWSDYQRRYGSSPDPSQGGYLAPALKGFFQNGGRRAFVAALPMHHGAARSSPECYIGAASDTARRETWTGLKAMEAVDEVSLLCIPDQPLIDDKHDGILARALVEQCERLRNRICILQSRQLEPNAADTLRVPIDSAYAAFYFPWLEITQESGRRLAVPPGGHIAGVIARTDSERGVHHAPANEPIRGAAGTFGGEGALSENAALALQNRRVNCLRELPGHDLRVWGARTTSSAPDWKYVNVRRLAIFLEAIAP